MLDPFLVYKYFGEFFRFGVLNSVVVLISNYMPKQIKGWSQFLFILLCSLCLSKEA